jgi:drug/metabolite transporter (DMT)-like permease
MAAGRPLRDWGLLLTLVALWGSAFMLTKIAVAGAPPLFIVAARLTLAAVVLIGLVFATGRSLALSAHHWQVFALMALTGNIVPFALITWGQQRIDSGVAGILMAVMPLTTIVLAHAFVPGERLTASKVSGFVLGFIGVVILVGPDALLRVEGSGAKLASQLAVLGGAVCYAITVIIARHRPECDALVAAAGVLVVASVVAAPVAIMVHPPAALDIPPASIAAITALGLLSTALATIVYFRLITSAGPGFFSLINYLIPVWAFGAGVALMGEEPSLRAIAALALILGGIAITEFRRTVPDRSVPRTDQSATGS